MTTKLQMVVRRGFGLPGRAYLNRGLLEALLASGASCERCQDIRSSVDEVPEGGVFFEAASFPWLTVQTLDAHFRSHWKTDYEGTSLPARIDGR